MASDSDQTLVWKCLEGHTRAFEGLIDRYQKPLYNVALRILNNEQDAADVTQTVFVKAFEKLTSYNPKYKFFSWIYRMAVNESLNFRKRRHRFETMNVGTIAQEHTPFDDVVALDLEERVGTALMFLTPEDRAIVLLKHFEQFSYKDIAYILEIPAKTVKSRLYTARQRLKDILVTKGFTKKDG